MPAPPSVFFGLVFFSAKTKKRFILVFVCTSDSGGGSTGLGWVGLDWAGRCVSCVSRASTADPASTTRAQVVCVSKLPALGKRARWRASIGGALLAFFFTRFCSCQLGVPDLSVRGQDQVSVEISGRQGRRRCESAQGHLCPFFLHFGGWCVCMQQIASFPLPENFGCGEIEVPTCSHALTALPPRRFFVVLFAGDVEL